MIVINDYKNNTFGDLTASLNYDPTRVNHRAESAVYIRPCASTVWPMALDLADAKNLHAHLGKLIDEVEAGIEAQKPVLPTAFGSVVQVGGKPWIRLEYGWWTDDEGHTVPGAQLQREDFTVLRDGIR